MTKPRKIRGTERTSFEVEGAYGVVTVQVTTDSVFCPTSIGYLSISGARHLADALNRVADAAEKKKR